MAQAKPLDKPARAEARKRIEAPAKGQQADVGFAPKYPATKTVGIPGSANTWLREPIAGGDRRVSFELLSPTEDTTDRIMGIFQTKLLRPGPTFSLRAALRANRSILGANFADQMFQMPRRIGSRVHRMG